MLWWGHPAAFGIGGASSCEADSKTRNGEPSFQQVLEPVQRVGLSSLAGAETLRLFRQLLRRSPRSAQFAQAPPIRGTSRGRTESCGRWTLCAAPTLPALSPVSTTPTPAAAQHLTGATSRAARSIAHSMACVAAPSVARTQWQCAPVRRACAPMARTTGKWAPDPARSCAMARSASAPSCATEKVAWRPSRIMPHAVLRT